MNKATWIVVGVVALFAMWYVSKLRAPSSANQPATVNPLQNLGFNYGAQGNLPDWRFGAGDPGYGHSGADRFGGDNNNLPDSGLSYSTDTGTWSQSNTDRRVN